MASAPWPGAGGMSSLSISEVTCCCRPSRVRPASARKVASIAAVVQLLQPRFDAAAQGDDLQIGPQMQGLGLAAQAGGADHRALRQIFRSFALWEMKASRGSSRAGIAASTMPSGMRVGRSFSE